MSHQRGYYTNVTGDLFWIERGKFGGYCVHDQREDDPVYSDSFPLGLSFVGGMWECPTVQNHIARFPACVAAPSPA